MRLFRRLLAPVLTLALAAVSLHPFALAQAKKAATKPAAAKPAAASPASGEPLDINTATPDQLKALPGIGDAYADRIIKARPYSAKNQLVQKGVLPEGTYSKIQNMIIAKRAK